MRSFKVAKLICYLDDSLVTRALDREPLKNLKEVYIELYTSQADEKWPSAEEVKVQFHAIVHHLP